MRSHEVCHVEIRTRDLPRAREFYSQVFDWKLVASSPGHLLIDTGSVPGGGMVEVAEPNAALGVCNYVLVHSCDEFARKAQSLGGRIESEKQEVARVGWFASVVDPWGNELGLWEPVENTSPAFVGSGVNAFCWLELSAPELAWCMHYYERLFGWRFTPEPSDRSYAFAEHGPQSVGVGLLGGEMGRAVAGTTTYVNVHSLEAADAQVLAAGGTVLSGNRAIPEVGDFSLFLDPEGNRLALFQEAKKVA